MKAKYTELLIFIAAAELVGALSALITGDYGSFFQKYAAPPLMPPSWVFPAVWAVLYALMGISAYMIYSSDIRTYEKEKALFLYAVQLAVNFSWSIVFFRFELLRTGTAIILLLIILVLLMIISFNKIKPAAALINIPYLLWLLFAAYLSAGTSRRL